MPGATIDLTNSGIGLPDVGFNQLDATQKATIAGIAAGFAGLLSLFNIGGRFFWASLSDKIGRKNTYTYTFFILGIVLYALAPTFAAMGSKLLFVLGFGIILNARTPRDRQPAHPAASSDPDFAQRSMRLRNRSIGWLY